MKNVYLFLTLLLLSSCFLGGCSKDETPQGTIISGTLESAIAELGKCGGMDH